ncbi:MAG: GHKL domain-containing protein [Bacillota bacterium]
MNLHEHDHEQIDLLQEQLQHYIKINEKLINELKNFRHDVLNILQGMNGLIELEDWVGLKTYINNILNNFKPGNQNQAAREKIVNPMLKVLLENKANKADQTGLNFNLLVDKNIKIGKELINENDLCNVIGIILDQGIETAARTNNKIISIFFIENGNSINIFIEYSFPNKPGKSGKPAIPQIDALSYTLSKYPNILYNTFVQYQVIVHQLRIEKIIKNFL